MNTRFLSVRAWIDEDGEHVWVAHDCLNGREATMLPNDKWRINPDRKTASPSFHCRNCECHTTAEIELGAPEVLSQGVTMEKP